MSNLALTHFDSKLKIVVEVDISEYNNEVVIFHKYEDGSTKPVAHDSRTPLAAAKKKKKKDPDIERKFSNDICS